MPDRSHEKSREELRTQVELPTVAEVIKQGSLAAKNKSGAWECPYYARTDEETELVRAWYKGFYGND